MKYKIYKFQFTTGVHLGKDSLEDGEYTLCADTIFSALCQECLKQGKDVFGKLLARTREGKLRFSDAFPFIGDTYYLPKPMLRIVNQQQGDSKRKKAYKKLSYIPMDKLEEYLSGNLDVRQEQDKFQDKLGRKETKVSAAVRGLEETMPYRVGIYHFCKQSGLYLILGYEAEEDAMLVETCLESLSYSGIGGKRASGLGRYELRFGQLPADLQQRLEATGNAMSMALSVCLPQDGELEAALEQAHYLLVKRSGFVASETYAKEQLRKRDLYVMQAGSCFRTRFEGDVYDVSDGGSHPVYRYAKPLLMEVIS